MKQRWQFSPVPRAQGFLADSLKELNLNFAVKSSVKKFTFAD